MLAGIGIHLEFWTRSAALAIWRARKERLLNSFQLRAPRYFRMLRQPDHDGAIRDAIPVQIVGYSQRSWLELSACGRPTLSQLYMSALCTPARMRLQFVGSKSAPEALNVFARQMVESRKYLSFDLQQRSMTDLVCHLCR